MLDTFIWLVQKEIRRYFDCRLTNIDLDEVAPPVNHYNRSRQMTIRTVNLSARKSKQHIFDLINSQNIVNSRHFYKSEVYLFYK